MLYTGGWLCFDRKSCEQRWINTPHLMSSDNWPLTRRGMRVVCKGQTKFPVTSLQCQHIVTLY